MARDVNPFVVTGKIEPEYFCDRVAESSRLVKSITKGNNLVLISPRRMGKTGLIRFCFDKEEIRDNYYCFFIDILHTTGLREFIHLLGKEIYETLQPHSKKMAKLFLKTLKSLNGKFGFDISTGLPDFSIALGDIEQPTYVLEEIFKYLESADKPCIVAIDEFQQIAKYPEKNVEALLRGHIQKSGNCHFIYAGSERHMMQQMFLSSKHPFHRSADMLELKEIAREVYIPFVVKNFKEFGKSITEEIVGAVYDFFRGHTFYIQKTFNESFADTPEGGSCTMEIVRTAITALIDSYDTIFREILSNIPEKQKELLYAIALDGEASAITSAAFIRKHSLSSASSVQSAVKKLLEKDLITENGKIYAVSDKFLGIWISAQFGTQNPLSNLCRFILSD